MIKDFTEGLFALVFSIAIIYGCYWVTKHISYAIFYESLVIETIKETVDEKYINKGEQ